MKNPLRRNKIYVKFRNGQKIVETYVDNNEQRKDLYELIKEEVFGKSDNGKNTVTGFTDKE